MMPRGQNNGTVPPAKVSRAGGGAQKRSPRSGWRGLLFSSVEGISTGMNVAAPDDAGLHVLFHGDSSWVAEAFRPVLGADLNGLTGYL